MLDEQPRIYKSLAVLLAVLLSACTNLSAVRDWSATSMEAAQFNEVVTTYADTPKRLVRAIMAKNPGGVFKAAKGLREALA